MIKNEIKFNKICGFSSHFFFSVIFYISNTYFAENAVSNVIVDSI